MFHQYTAVPTERLVVLFASQTGYAAPKIDVSAALFDDADRILMVRERADERHWSPLGGWADLNITSAQNAVKETREESGYEVDVTKLAAVLDRTRQRHPHGIFSCAKMFFLCCLTGGAATTGLETPEIGWFAQSDVPADLSLDRMLSTQIAHMFEHKRRPNLATDFE